jgi:hypothetical protein
MLGRRLKKVQLLNIRLNKRLLLGDKLNNNNSSKSYSKILNIIQLNKKLQLQELQRILTEVKIP